jgi:5,10-methylenetetrahydromethanopterin reductase
MSDREKIGYSLGPLLSMQQVLEFAKMADKRQQIDSLWVPESWGRESFATLGALSQVTERIRLGTSIVNIYSRTPATVAMAATTIDMLSKNRTVIGLGSSTAAIVENWHGMKFEQPVDRMREYINCLSLISTGEKVNYDGRFLKVKNFKILHRPTRMHIPIFIAAINKRMLSAASELADGVLLYLRPREELKKVVRDLRSENNNTHSRKNFEIACTFVCAISNKEPEKARERAAKTLAFYIGTGKYYGKFLSENGFREEVGQIISEYREKGGDSAAKVVSNKMLDSLTICGSSEECNKSLARFRSTGITLPIMQLNPLDDTEDSFMEVLSTF